MIFLQASTLDSGIEIGPTFINFRFFFQALLPLFSVRLPLHFELKLASSCQSFFKSATYSDIKYKFQWPSN